MGDSALKPVEHSAAILAAVKAGVPAKAMRCEFERAQSAGSFVRKGRVVTISYDLVLCKWCGNLEESPNNRLYCPAKLRAILAPLKLLPPSKD